MWIVFIIIAAFLIVTANVVILAAIFNCFQGKPQRKAHSSGSSYTGLRI